MKYTQGDWQLHPWYGGEIGTVPADVSHDGRTWDYAYRKVAVGNTIIATVDYDTCPNIIHHVNNREEMEANAKLISAAKDMFEALESYVKKKPNRKAAIAAYGKAGGEL